MEDESNVTPQEQRQYDLVMQQARGILFGKGDDDSGFRIVLDKLGQGRKQIGETIGHTAAMVLLSVQKGIAKKGRQVPPEILFHAGDEVIDDLIEIAEAAKLMDAKDTERVKKEAMFEALRIAGQTEIDEGRVTPEKQAAAKAEMQQVLAMAQKKPGAAAPEKPAEPAGIVDKMRRK